MHLNISRILKGDNFCRQYLNSLVRESFHNLGATIKGERKSLTKHASRCKIDPNRIKIKSVNYI